MIYHDYNLTTKLIPMLTRPGNIVNISVFMVFLKKKRGDRDIAIRIIFPVF